ncbi:MAG: hypothetical protein KKA73_31385 [Chloroflexi bacterium]|nr:hypothetical protein [Chloroflexota bacterium]MBU1752206.1 hypothetical protein [Chloroflexota bacterium]MBU1877400.1 hypothetical protein [Chloroflexota bacterium]
MSRALPNGIMLLLALIVPPLLILGVALVLSLVPLPQALDRSRNLVAAVCAGMLGLIYIAGLAGYVLWSLLGYAQDADPAFTSLGLRAGAYGLFGRQYHGSVQGRATDVYYIPPHRLHAGTLEIYVQSTLQTRFTASRGRAVLGCEGCQPVPAGDPALAGLRIQAQDQAWAGRLLVDPAAGAALRRLMGDSGWRELYVQPGRLLLRQNARRAITPEAARQWFADLDAVAGAGESLAGAPAPSAAPPDASLSPGDLVTPIVVGILVIAGLPVACLCLGSVLWALISRAR